MIESVRHFIDLIFDKSKSWGLKTATTISILGLLVLLDLGFGFSYDWQISTQLEQLEKIQVLKKDFQDAPTKLKKIITIENRTLKREHYSDFFTRKYNKLVSTENSNIEQRSNEDDIHQYPKRALFWMIVTSNFIFALIFPFLLLLPIYAKDGRTANALVGWFASIIFISILASFITWISYQIPLIDNNPKWNYILNFVIHIVFIGVIVKYSDSSGKKN